VVAVQQMVLAGTGWQARRRPGGPDHRERAPRLAEGRYVAGAGSIIELADAQLSATRAAAQKVGAEYDLSNARAQWPRLGRR
jgi:hypothetical protein